MSFTGRLGSASSKLGRMVLASETGTPTQTLQIRANILVVQAQTVQLRANILGVSSASIQLRANIASTSQQSLEMRAHILAIYSELTMRARIVVPQSLQMRAAILKVIEADLNVTFDALVAVDQRLMVRYQIGDKEPAWRALTMRANILQTVTADLTVRYQVDYDHMPTDCIGRPKTRVYVTEN